MTKKVICFLVVSLCSFLGAVRGSQKGQDFENSVRSPDENDFGSMKSDIIKFGDMTIDLKKFLIEEPWTNKLACIKSVYKFMGNQEVVPSPKELRNIFYPCFRYFSGKNKEKSLVKEVYDLSFVIAKHSHEGDWNYEMSKKVALRSAQFLRQEGLTWSDDSLVRGMVNFGTCAAEALTAIAVASFVRRPLAKKYGNSVANGIIASIGGVIGCGVLFLFSKLQLDKMKLQNQINILKAESK